MTRSEDDDVKNSLPNETDDHADSGMPRQLRTQADGETPLSRAEADVAGITAPVYGDDDMNPNADDQRDAQQ
jgi:hypothetical protein